MLHGYTDSWFSFSDLLRLLPARYRAFAFSQRGHGDSERPTCCYTMDDFAADVVAFLDAMGVERATVVSHSMGSLAARRMAEAYPERVARLVLVSSPASLSGEMIQGLRAAVQTLEDPISPEFSREWQVSNIYHPVPEPFLERIVAETLKVPARVWRSVSDGWIAFDDAADLGRIAAPTLILWGERDALFGRQEQDRLAAAIPGARLTVYPDTGHCPNWERPEDVAADLNAFLLPA